MTNTPLQKIRTFHDDFERAKKAGHPAGPTGTAPKEPAAPKPQPEPSKPKTAPPKPAKPVVPPKPKPIKPVRPKPARRGATLTIPKRKPTSRPVSQPAAKLAADEPTSGTSLAASVAKVAKPEQRSVLLDDDTFHMSDSAVGTGSIIRETKRRKFRLLPAIIASLQQWFTTKQAAYQARQEPQYTVRDVAERTDVVEQAVIRSTLAPTDDVREVSKRLQKTERTKAAPARSYDITAASEVPAPHWSHLEGEAEVPTAETEDKLTVPPVSEPPIAEPTVATDEAEPVPAAAAAPSEVTPRAQPGAPPVPPDAEAMPVTAVPPEPAAPATVTDSPAATTAPAPTASPTTGSARRRWLLVALVLLTVSVLGVALSWWFFGGGTATPTERPRLEQVTNTTSTGAAATVPLGTNRQALYSALGTTSLQPENPFLVPEVTTFGTPTPAEPTAILATVRWQIPGSFARSLTTIRFGRYNNAPFVALTAENFDTAFAGMLAWETAMSRDLSPLFGQPVTGTFDPRNPGVVAEPFFADTVVSNRDVRVLRDENESERLVYTFVDQTTILITTSSADLTEIISRLR